MLFLQLSFMVRIVTDLSESNYGYDDSGQRHFHLSMFAKSCQNFSHAINFSVLSVFDNHVM
jgi:hypothetical protein